MCIRDSHIEGPDENGCYVVNGTATNPVYGTHPLSDIKIYVTASTDGRNMQTVHVEIPAALLPLRQTTIMENVDGLVTSFTHNSAYPLRLVYSVGLQDGVLNSDGSVNLGVVSPDYIAQHTVDGRVQFYEGYYSAEEQPGEVGLDNKTIGNAHVSYTPALDNPFYYVDADTPLYTDAGCTTPVSYTHLVFVPAVSTFYISQKLGSPGSTLIGDVIESQFKGAYNPNLGAAMSLVLMALIFLCVGIMNRFSGSDDEEGMVTL